MLTTNLLAALPASDVATLNPTVPGPYRWAILCILLPLVGAAFLLLIGKAGNKWGHWIGVLMSTLAFVAGAYVFIEMLRLPANMRGADYVLTTWLKVGRLDVPLGLRIDQLSITFVLLVTFVGTLIHFYAVAYMSHDRDRRRFFAYLNLFIAAMLMLVLADNYLLLFFGWEGVGLASYLLIGFWNHETQNAVAAKKAFVMNRVGDLGMIAALMLMFWAFHAVDFQGVAEAVSKTPQIGIVTAIGLMLLLAACGKSAQFPLQAWLGDAMAGPTPVSALIHAATMVTAGVYLIVRSAPIFDAAPDARLIVVIVGGITLLFGAIVGCAKDDIKKALAASTMSQIGYMILAAGLGPIGYAFAIFHLVTHGFFKANMFLGAGSVMHGMNDSVNMRRFGALFKPMMITAITFVCGWAAIIGVPFLSGYYSKDKIIEAAFIPTPGREWEAWVFGSVALLGAAITAFYMTRLVMMTFFSHRRWNNGTGDVDGTGPQDGPVQHPHESSPLMTVPMIILAIGSLVLGGILASGSRFVDWLAPVVTPGSHGEHAEPVLPVVFITVATLVLIVVGVVAAIWMYGGAKVPVTAPAGTVATRAARKDLYQDDVNENVFMRPGQYLTRSLVFADRQTVDGGWMGLAGLLRRFGEWLRGWQNGYARTYAASMVGGVVVIAAVVLVLVSNQVK